MCRKVYSYDVGLLDKGLDVLRYVTSPVVVRYSNIQDINIALLQGKLGVAINGDHLS